MSFLSQIFKGGAEGLTGGLAKLIGTMKADPTQVLQLQAELAKAEAILEGKIIAAESAALVAINQAMQAEAKSDHWMQYAWRPSVGFTFCAVIINNYILYPYFAEFGMHLANIPVGVWTAMLAVLGAAAYTRGTEKIARIKLKG